MREIRELLAYSRAQRRSLIVGGLLSAMGALASLLQPLVAKDFVEALGAEGSVFAPSLWLGVLIVGGAVAAALGTYVIERSAEGVVLGARRHLLARLISLRVSAAERFKPGDLLSRATADTTLLRQAATGNLVDVATGLCSLIGMTFFMYKLDGVLFAVVSGILIVVGSATVTVMPRIGMAGQKVQIALAELASGLERSLGALRTIKASGAEEREISALNDAAERAYQHGVRAAGWGALAGVSTSLIIQMSFLAVLGVGGARVESGALPLSSLIAFLLYLFYLTGPIGLLVNGASGLQAGLAAVRRIGEISDLECEPVLAAPRAEQVLKSPLAFEEVTFSYHSNEPAALSDVSFELPAGGLTAIVGPSGAGKSTIFSLLERFYDPQNGKVTLDGRNIREISLQQLRSTIGYVEQDAPVLDGTLRENLLLSAPWATEAELASIISATRLEALIKRLPSGLDSPVGHRGAALSGGERQRVAIARTLLRRPTVLLLDEVTSQLDSVNELQIREAVADISRETTVLVIAHRLSTVTTADRILVMDKGRICARGTHQELIAIEGIYQDLATKQLLGDSVRPRVPS
ncbi:ABC transporter ATP-binding protein [Streptomyces sp. NPDC085927]|uniref:ABC transporter ATP-binding protein n=1 Tax=Streptomyces sp. NPDC085927 TaxID=3365738 RepID=UPI0037CE0EA0